MRTPQWWTETSDPVEGMTAIADDSAKSHTYPPAAVCLTSKMWGRRKRKIMFYESRITLSTKLRRWRNKGDWCPFGKVTLYSAGSEILSSSEGKASLSLRQSKLYPRKKNTSDWVIPTHMASIWYLGFPKLSSIFTTFDTNLLLPVPPLLKDEI